MNHLSTECEQNLRGWAAPTETGRKREVGKESGTGAASQTLMVNFLSLVISDVKRVASEL